MRNSRQIFFTDPGFSLIKINIFLEFRDYRFRTYQFQLDWFGMLYGCFCVIEIFCLVFSSIHAIYPTSSCKNFSFFGNYL